MYARRPNTPKRAVWGKSEGRLHKVGFIHNISLASHFRRNPWANYDTHHHQNINKSWYHNATTYQRVPRQLICNTHISEARGSVIFKHLLQLLLQLRIRHSAACGLVPIHYLCPLKARALIPPQSAPPHLLKTPQIGVKYTPTKASYPHPSSRVGAYLSMLRIQGYISSRLRCRRMSCV